MSQIPYPYSLLVRQTVTWIRTSRLESGRIALTHKTNKLNTICANTISVNEVQSIIRTIQIPFTNLSPNSTDSKQCFFLLNHQSVNESMYRSHSQSHSSKSMLHETSSHNKDLAITLNYTASVVLLKWFIVRLIRIV